MQVINRKKILILKELGNSEVIARCAKEFQIIGDPTRIKICYLLCRHDELTVSEIADLVNVSVSAVSHTLRKLKRANLVRHYRQFRNVYYSLNDSPLTDIVRARLEA
ncbi:winged helix-turn-helix transcriptional regulator [Candidatus Berkelbacteria bacterium]|nr:winged helix-turn-helix transcriptional regulator [Candidatus Berkelbacteria bacterium]